MACISLSFLLPCVFSLCLQSFVFLICHNTYLCTVICLCVGVFHDPMQIRMRLQCTVQYWCRVQRGYDMNGRFQMQGGKNWFFPKEMNANRFFWDSHWLEIWSNNFCPSMGPNGGSVAIRTQYRCTVARGIVSVYCVVCCAENRPV